jgi:hypothetical protein
MAKNFVGRRVGKVLFGGGKGLSSGFLGVMRVLRPVLSEVAKVFRCAPENKNNGHFMSSSSGKRPWGVPVMAAGSNAGVEIGVLPDLGSFIQELSKWLPPSTAISTQ